MLQARVLFAGEFEGEGCDKPMIVIPDFKRVLASMQRWNVWTQQNHGNGILGRQSETKKSSAGRLLTESFPKWKEIVGKFNSTKSHKTHLHDHENEQN